MSSDIKKNLKRGIVIIFLSNIINMLFKIFIYIFQPKFLSIETYAALQTFNLYFAYAGLLHFGYVDGMYLKFGGKNFDDLGKDELYKDAKLLKCIEIVTVILLLIVSVLLKNCILFFASVALLPGNMAAYYRMMFQATGQFKKYGRIMNFNTILLFIYNFVLIVWFRCDNYVYFIICEVIIYYIIWIMLESKFYKAIDKKNKKVLFDKDYILNNIKNGLPLTLGNLATNFFSSLDRWFIKIFLSTASFAYYSFAVSVETFLNIAITPITITLYNYFCQTDNEKELNKVKKIVTMLAITIVSAVFPAKFILMNIMKKYIFSINILMILFASKIFSIIIQGIYVNMYKAQKKQKLYLKNLIISIIIGLVTNTIALTFFKVNEAFAIATVFTIFIWFLLCKKDFKIIKYDYKEIIGLVVLAITLVISGIAFNPVLGVIIYLSVVCIVIRINYYSEMKLVLTIIKNKLKKQR